MVGVIGTESLIMLVLCFCLQQIKKTNDSPTAIMMAMNKEILRKGIDSQFN